VRTASNTGTLPVEAGKSPMRHSCRPEPDAAPSPGAWLPVRASRRSPWPSPPSWPATKKATSGSGGQKRTPAILTPSAPRQASEDWRAAWWRRPPTTGRPGRPTRTRVPSRVTTRTHEVTQARRAQPGHGRRWPVLPCRGRIAGRHHGGGCRHPVPAGGARSPRPIRSCVAVSRHPRRGRTAVVACGRIPVRGPNPFPGGGWVPGRIRPQGWAEAGGAITSGTRPCRNAITRAGVTVGEIRLGAHARPLDEP
jgi:hypothetical protein